MLDAINMIYINILFASCIRKLLYIYISSWKALIYHYHRLSGDKPDKTVLLNQLAPEVVGFSRQGCIVFSFIS